ncbi:hypothetical protein T310_2181 [Rasamsonia emersonii CBS 393.64]|uniref:Uncharacterized protein n=1 Tax=Rasamsonia emersonii (strain ATCC 16479 / CBS 393.64 / IMI 116815) TaxID=1408163 RepID=A0A0F4YZR6_RASE3|nr:hypothetical protein T310_2181 [Rasamsonia emersonii CBS 393.64]KKA23729.1 hypothetical protein T310_2181 [Rasamsonia emersonii CBS 393.64]
MMYHISLYDYRIQLDRPWVHSYGQIERLIWWDSWDNPCGQQLTSTGIHRLSHGIYTPYLLNKSKATQANLVVTLASGYLDKSDEAKARRSQLAGTVHEPVRHMPQIILARKYIFT